MPNIKKINTVQPSTRLVNSFKTTALLAPFALSMMGGAQASTDLVGDMTTKATGGVTAIGTGVGSVLLGLLVIVLAFLAYGVFKKPKA